METVISSRRIFFKRLLSGTLMIAGTAIGAGMLGIPLVTFQAGFWAAAAVTLLVWVFMWFTGLLFLEVSLTMPMGSNLLTMVEKFLGNKWKWIAGGMFLFLYYSLMVAYFAGGAPIFGSLFGLQGSIAYLVFGLLLGIIIGMGPQSIDRANLFLWICKVVAYVGLVIAGSSAVQFPFLNSGTPSTAYLAIPVLFGAFGYHNIIPSLCTYFEKDRTALRLSLFFGTFLSLIVYLLWIWVILGSISQERLRETLIQGLPATEALQSITQNSWVFRFGQWFGFIALSTSVLGVSFSMVDFLKDGANRKGPRWLFTVLTLFPPMAFALYNPAIFDQALGMAGGFGEAFLNGMLPVLLVWRSRKIIGEKNEAELKGGKPFLIILFLLSLAVFFVEILHLFSYSNLKQP